MNLTVPATFPVRYRFILKSAYFSCGANQSNWAYIIFSGPLGICKVLASWQLHLHLGLLWCVMFLGHSSRFFCLLEHQKGKMLYMRRVRTALKRILVIVSGESLEEFAYFDSPLSLIKIVFLFLEHQPVFPITGISWIVPIGRRAPCCNAPNNLDSLGSFCIFLAASYRNDISGRKLVENFPRLCLKLWPLAELPAHNEWTALSLWRRLHCLEFTYSQPYLDGFSWYPWFWLLVIRAGSRVWFSCSPGVQCLLQYGSSSCRLEKGRQWYPMDVVIQVSGYQISGYWGSTAYRDTL